MGLVILILLLVGIDLMGLYLILRFVWFYRDPERVPEEEKGAIISPADGQVVYIKGIEKGKISSEKLGREIKLEEIAKFSLNSKIEGWIVGIYMSPLDVHFNYAPIAGRVEKIVHTKTEANLPMADLLEYVNLAYLRRTSDNFAKRFHFENERNTILLKGEEVSVMVVEIADKFVNKIKCSIEEGQQLSLGEKIGFIDRGSQVDLIIFKEELDFRVKFGDQVYGGKSIIAKY